MLWIQNLISHEDIDLFFVTMSFVILRTLIDMTSQHLAQEGFGTVLTDVLSFVIPTVAATATATATGIYNNRTRIRLHTALHLGL